MAILVEGLAAIALPCSLALLAPGVVVALLARDHTVVAAFVGGVAVTIWWGATGRPIPSMEGWTAVASGAVLGVALTVLAIPNLDCSPNEAAGGRAAQGWAGATVGTVAALLWQPCVGSALGSALTIAPEQPAATLLPLFLYVVAVASPLWVGVAIARRTPKRVWMLGGGAAGLALTAAVTVGRYDDLAGWLLRLSA